MKVFILRPNGTFIVGALSLMLPSIGLLQKYLGLAGVAGYLVTASLILLLGIRRVLLRGLPPVSETKAVLLLILTFFVICYGYSIVYPLANAGVFGGGRDCDDALNIAVTELIHGRYPYYPKTYLGNPISPLPGAVLLATPFVLLGNSAYQNIFWLFAFLWATKSYLQDWRSSLFFLWTSLALSPAVLYHIFSGNDYLANSLYILVFSFWMIRVVAESGHGESAKLIAACLLGIGLSSRANFVLILPLVFAALAENSGWKSAVKYTGVSCAVFILITAPFYFYDPAGFSPLHAVNKIKRYRSLLPYSEILITAVTGLVAVALSRCQTVEKNNFGVFFRNCAIVLSIPVLSGVLFSSLMAGSAALTFAGYGAFFLFFGAIAFWKDLLKSEEDMNVARAEAEKR